MQRIAPLALIVLAYLLVGGLYAIYTPNWQAPDEPAHYNYVRQLASGQLPIIEPGDYDQRYQSLVISSQFDPKYSVESFEYEDYQPPLYYLLQTPIFWLFDGLLRPLRLISVLIGAGVVVLTYAVALRLFPDRRWLALTAAAFVAFLPQHVAMSAAVNNDSLAELLVAAILLQLVILVSVDVSEDSGERSLSLDHPSSTRDHRRESLILIGLGLCLGLGFLTKATVYIMVPVIGLTLLWRYWRNWRQLFQAGLIVFGLATLIGVGWWVRNVLVYGGLDVLGISAHNNIVIGQPRTEDWIRERGTLATLGAFFQTSFQSFWGQFGWMGVVMPAWVYRFLLLFTVAVVVGLLGAVNQRRKSKYFGTDYRLATTANLLPAVILLSTLVISLLLFLGYNVTFVQHQGRYIFPALIPISLGVALGWAVLLGPLAKPWPAVTRLLPLGLAMALIALDLLALFRYIVPSLT